MKKTLRKTEKGRFSAKIFHFSILKTGKREDSSSTQRLTATVRCFSGRVVLQQQQRPWLARHQPATAGCPQVSSSQRAAEIPKEEGDKAEVAEVRWSSVGAWSPHQGWPAPGGPCHHRLSAAPGQRRGVSYTRGPCIALAGLEITSFADSAQVCQILEILLCLQDWFAGDRIKRSRSVRVPLLQNGGFTVHPPGAATAADPFRLCLCRPRGGNVEEWGTSADLSGSVALRQHLAT